jgi:uncharacterized protein YyaL (SSP411 family)
MAHSDPEDLRAAELPLTADRPPLNGQPAAYFCRNSVCQQPTADPEELARQMTV